MRKRLLGLIAAVSLGFCACSAFCAEEQSLCGWRGNWAGKFPDSTAPTTWGRVSKLMNGLRSQAAKPKDGKASGAPVYYGTIPEWLVLGPFVPADEDLKKAIGEEFIKEADAQPDEGERLGDKTWKKAAGEGSYLNLEPLFDKPAKGWTAYAHTYIYSEEAGPVILRFLTLPAIDVKAWVNGKEAFLATKWRYWWESQFGHKVDLVKGWNRVLIKIVRGPPGEGYISPWRFSFFFYAAAPYEWAETKNIAWAAKIPGEGCIAGPVIAGGKIFTMSDPFDLVCLDKKDGKILWIRPHYYFDALTDEEKKNPAFQEVLQLAEELKTLDGKLCEPNGITKEACEKKTALEQKIIGLLAKADPKKYTYRPEHPGNCVPTPVTDGKNIYVWTGLGVLGCYDLEGNRKWIRIEKTAPVAEHGNCSSPLLSAGRLIIFDTAPQNTIAFDAATGAEVWRHTADEMRDKYPKCFSKAIHMCINGSGTPYPFRIQDTDVAILQNAIFRVADGKVLWTPPTVFENFQNLIATHVLDNGILYSESDGIASRDLIMAQVPDALDKDGLVALKRLGNFPIVHAGGVQNTGHCLGASPLYHDGLIYIIDMIGRLRVYDVKAKALLYEKNLGFPDNRAKVYQMGSCYTSPTLVGKHVIVSSHTGTWVVFETGREFKLVAVNRLENELPKAGDYTYCQHPEIFVASPIAEEKRLYIRGDECLYCIGAK